MKAINYKVKIPLFVQQKAMRPAIIQNMSYSYNKNVN